MALVGSGERHCQTDADADGKRQATGGDANGDADANTQRDP